MKFNIDNWAPLEWKIIKNVPIYVNKDCDPYIYWGAFNDCSSTIFHENYYSICWRFNKRYVQNHLLTQVPWYKKLFGYKFHNCWMLVPLWNLNHCPIFYPYTHDIYYDPHDWNWSYISSDNFNSKTLKEWFKKLSTECTNWRELTDFMHKQFKQRDADYKEYNDILQKNNVVEFNE